MMVSAFAMVADSGSVPFWACTNCRRALRQLIMLRRCCWHHATGAAFAAGASPKPTPGATNKPRPTAETASPTTSRACFTVLGMEPATAQGQYTSDEVKAAYKRAARDVHPDMPSGSEEQFRHVQIAYEFLKKQPGAVANDTVVLDADGKPVACAAGGGGAGFYAHPHNSQYGSPNRPYGQGRPRTMHTTRTRYDEDLGHGVEEPPEPATAAFVNFAHRWGSAVREGKGREFINTERAKKSAEWAQAAAEEQDRRSRMDAAAREWERQRRFINAFWIGRLAFKVGFLVLFTYSVYKAMEAYFALHRAMRDGGYTPEYIESLASVKTNVSTVKPGVMYSTPNERDMADMRMQAEHEHRMRHFVEARASADTNKTYAAKFRGKPFTAQGVLEVAEEGQQKRTMAAARRAGTEAELADATAGTRPTTHSLPPREPLGGPSTQPDTRRGSATPVTLEALSAATQGAARQAQLTRATSEADIKAQAALLASAGSVDDGDVFAADAEEAED